MVNDDVILKIAQPVGAIACRKCGQAIDVGGLPVFEITECPSCQTRQKVPTQLGHFLLFDVLGRGGMAAVYRAQDRALGRQVAIKVMRSELGEDPQFVGNFLREARSAAQLNHPNIVQIYAVDEAGGFPYIVMELLDGGRMDDMIAKGKPLGERFVLKSGLDVAEGLAAAAAHGLIHGDVKPANILYDRAGNAKIADFGLARFQQKPLTKGEIWGTPYYIAPEKVRERREDFRSDIYSLGATLFHALALKPPFEADTATNVVLARLKQPPPSLDGFRTDLHPSTKALILRMLEPDPALRYPTYASLTSDIRATLDTLRAEGPASGVIRKPASRRRRKGPLVVFLILLLAALAGGAVWFLKFRKPSTSIADGPGGPPPASQPDTPPAVALLPVQPFSAAEQATLKKAFDALAGGDIRTAERTWVEVANSLPAGHGGRAWIALFLAVPPWSRGELTEVQRRVASLLKARYDPQPGGAPNPALLPQSLALAATGQPFSAPEPAMGSPWPEWYHTLARLFQGGQAMADGKLDEAIEHLDAYLSPPAGDPAWPAGFQPVAAALKRQTEEWKAYVSAIDARIETKDGGTVITELEVRRVNGKDGLLAPLIVRQIRVAQTKQDAWLKREDAKRAAQDEKLKKKAEQERKLQIKAEMDKVNSFRETFAGFMPKQDFRGALDAARGLSQSVTAADAKAGTAFWLDAATTLNGLYDRLADLIKAAPMRTPAVRQSLRGDVVGATSKGIYILLGGGAGTTERSWDSLPPGVFLEICAHYARQLPADEQGRLYLALALYTHSTPQVQTFAPRIAAMAIKADPKTRDLLARHVPDLDLTATDAP